jgi:hypothetical protein
MFLEAFTPETQLVHGIVSIRQRLCEGGVFLERGSFIVRKYMKYILVGSASMAFCKATFGV